MNAKKNPFLDFSKKNKCFKVKSDYQSVIPLKIFTHWHTLELPEIMTKNYNKMKNDNPEFEHYLYSDTQCREFIKENFDQEILNTYDGLIPYSYKSDLWRFCVLYTYGGIYVDIKYNCINGFKYIALTEKEHFCLDLKNSGNGIYTNPIVVKPGNIKMLNCINKIKENVRNKYYGNTALEPTGPLLLSTFFTNEEKINLQLQHEKFCYKDKIFYYIMYLDTYILKIYNEYREEQSKHQNQEHYHILWTERNIYS
jgi:mannosyltransferase OCH1-like enzyme